MCGANGQPGLRAKLFDAQIQAKAFLLKCVVGSADFSDLAPMVAQRATFVMHSKKRAAGDKL